MDWGDVGRAVAPWAPVVSSFFAMVSAGAAWLNIRLVLNNRRAERRAARPFFGLKDSAIKHIDGPLPHRTEIVVANFGGRPAYNIIGYMLLIEATLKKKVGQLIDFSLANELPPQIDMPIHRDSLYIEHFVEPLYILLVLDYLDPILDEEFVQWFILSWAGLHGSASGKMAYNIDHASIGDSERVFEYIETEMPGLLSPDVGSHERQQLVRRYLDALKASSDDLPSE
jgi:hypothetical protein